MLDDSIVHILGGGIGGTVAAVLTSPLEVVKVRLQSSKGGNMWTPNYPLPAASPHQHHPTITQQQAALHHRLASTSNACPPSTSFPPITRFCVPPVTNHSGRFTCAVASATSTHVCACRGVAPKHQLMIRMRLFPGGRPRLRFYRSTILHCFSSIARNEGVGALFKGLLPTLVGVLPSRGLYFYAYHKGQHFFQEYFAPSSSAVFICSAGLGSITSSSFTAPIWYVKTRLQLDSRPGKQPVTVMQVIRETWRSLGVRGFYRGISASYVGSLETALNFVIYENVKGWLLQWARQRRAEGNGIDDADPCKQANTQEDLRGTQGGSKLSSSSDMGFCMVASACSKFIAITASYPHEVVRTRLREDGGKYRTFVGTIRTVFAEEGLRGLYRGLGTHYIRQIPNSCIMIGTYEGVLYLLQSWGFTKKY